MLWALEVWGRLRRTYPDLLKKWIPFSRLLCADHLNHCSLLCFLYALFPVGYVIDILFLTKPVNVSVRQQQLKFQAHLLYLKHCANALQ